MVDLAAQQAQSSVSSTGSPGTPPITPGRIDDAAIADEVLGHRRGHRRGVGRVLATQAYGTPPPLSSTSGSSSQTVSQVGELRAQLQQKDQELLATREELHEARQERQEMRTQLQSWIPVVAGFLRQQGLQLPMLPLFDSPGLSRFAPASSSQPVGPSQAADPLQPGVSGQQQPPPPPPPAHRQQTRDSDDEELGTDDDTSDYLHSPSP